MTRVVYFTFGTVGAGHLARGVAVGCALERAGAAVSYTMVGPRLPFAAAQRSDYRAVETGHEPLMSPETAVQTPLARLLQELDPEVLLVDLFWAPLRFVLPVLRCEAWLLLRYVPDRWLEGPPGVPFMREQYARVLAIEPFAPKVPHERWEPIVVANPGERDETLSGLDVVVHAGKAEERDALCAAAPPGARVLSLWEEQAPFPLAPQLAAARSVTCAAGYNAYWEARWLDYAERTRFITFPRAIDDQRWRVSSCAAERMTQNGADRLARELQRGG